MRHLLVMIISFIIVSCITLTAQTESTQCNICPPTNIELKAPVYNEKGKLLGIHKVYIQKGSLPTGTACPSKDVKIMTNAYKDKELVTRGEVLIKKGWLDDPSHYKAVDKIPKYKYKPKKMIIVPPDNMTHWHVELNKN